MSQELVHTLTDSQLQRIIRDAVIEANEETQRIKARAITPKNIFEDVALDMKELEVIHSEYPKVAELLGDSNMNRIFCNTPKQMYHGPEYQKLYSSELHNQIRKLTLAVFGKTLNVDLTRDEYGLAQDFYSQLVDWYLSAYRKRLKELYGASEGCETDESRRQSSSHG